MFQAYGLYGHIQANRMRSVLLLVGFVALLHALLFSILLLWQRLHGRHVRGDRRLAPGRSSRAPGRSP